MAYLLGIRSCWWVNTAKLLRTVLKLARTYEKNNIVGPYQKHIRSTFFFIYSNLFTASYFSKNECIQLSVFLTVLLLSSKINNQGNDNLEVLISYAVNLLLLENKIVSERE